MPENPITASVDFDQDGLQHGFLKLPHSHDASAWGSIMIPISVAKNGTGPTLLLTGGNHGDEYEGPIALFDLANSIEMRNLSGRVIIVPAMNYPAFQAGRRTSPIDRGNMNRIFPGDPAGGITEKIADYFQRYLLPLADCVLDIHSGGKTLDFVPFCAAHVLDDKAQEARCVAAMQAFDAPYSMMLREIDAVGMYDTAAEDMGKTFVSTELGGGGSAKASTIAIAKKGITNLMVHMGILSKSSPQIGAGAQQTSIHPASINLAMPDDRCFISSQSRGLVEFLVDLGGPVHAGESIASIHDIERTGTSPVTYESQMDGILAGRHFPGLIAMGDIIAVIAVEV